ncbi:MAG: hypothetical protein KGJ58_01300 [Patescibacteria group bacterium]|nr:hypothetical protein [Patescibacteria group bacterium]MDE1988685.1 hypothetical protein [Patescibacteria group bacterium]MDE2218074.1 hypothetical protein [Patescibacteria group bacterium]
MNSEERELLERTLKISEENNKILKGIRRSNRLATGFKVFYWLVIIGLGFGAYYLIEPYVKEFRSVYSQFINIINHLGK